MVRAYVRGENGLLLPVKYDLWFSKMIHIEHINKPQTSQQPINENWTLNDRPKSIIRLLHWTNKIKLLMFNNAVSKP